MNLTSSNDKNVSSSIARTTDSIQALIGLITISKTKELRNALNGLIQVIWAQTRSWKRIEGGERVFQPINIVQVEKSQKSKATIQFVKDLKNKVIIKFPRNETALI